MSDKKKTVGDKLRELEDIINDIESDCEGLRAMREDFEYRPAYAIVNDLVALIAEAREAFDVDGKKLYDALDDSPAAKENRWELEP